MKKSLTFVFMLTLCLIAAVSIKAADNTATSDATVIFTADTDPTSPVNPENPNETSTDIGTGMAGPLSIDYVPTLNFGTQVITGEVETYNVLDTRTHLQVTDKRGTGEGWKVTASLSNFTATDAPTKMLPGAVISFSNKSVATTTGNISPAPTVSNFSLTAGGSSAVVANAAVDAGMGIWVEKWFSSNLAGESNENVKLTVNTADAYAKTYTATITWTISAAP